RLAELARCTLLGPEERQRLQQEAEASQELLVQAQQSFDQGNFSIAVEFFGKARKARPGDVRVEFLFERADRRARQAALEEARRREWERQQIVAAEIQRR